MLTGFKAQNHPQQTGTRGALDEVDDRGTHPDYFDPWNARFGGFTLDAAAAPHNAKCSRYFTREDDGLSQSWAGERVWCNPPYSNLGDWLAKAWAEWPTTRGIVMLLPANRVEQKWWQEHVEPFRDRAGSPLRVEFLPGRMRFIRPNAVIGPKGDRPPFGCALLIWEAPDAADRLRLAIRGALNETWADTPSEADRMTSDVLEALRECGAITASQDWEYGVDYNIPGKLPEWSPSLAHAHQCIAEMNSDGDLFDDIIAVRRRKAGRWEPVPVSDPQRRNGE